MKAAIIGYGKMGREIERILTERGHEAALIIDTDNAHELDAAHLAGIDVALEFTTPETAYRNIRTCIECGVAAVSGTTGWTDRLAELQKLCRERGGALFYESNTPPTASNAAERRPPTGSKSAPCAKAPSQASTP